MLAPIFAVLMAITPTDQTVQVAKGTKLDINNFAGDVNIKVWDKDAVRVEVNNSDRETVDIKQGEQTLTVRSRSLRGGRPRSLDYTITVPEALVDNCFGLPLWLQTPYAGHVLWAFNARHLAYDLVGHFGPLQQPRRIARDVFALTGAGKRP